MNPVSVLKAFFNKEFLLYGGIGIGFVGLLIVGMSTMSLPTLEDELTMGDNAPAYHYEQVQPYTVTGIDSQLYLTFLDQDTEYDFGYVNDEGNFTHIHSFESIEATEEYGHYQFNYSLTNYKERGDFQLGETGWVHQIRNDDEIEYEFDIPSGIVFSRDSISNTDQSGSCCIGSEDVETSHMFERSDKVMAEGDGEGSNANTWRFRFYSSSSESETYTLEFSDIQDESDGLDNDLNYDPEKILVEVDRFDNELVVSVWSDESEEYDEFERYPMTGYSEYEVGRFTNSDNWETTAYMDFVKFERGHQDTLITQDGDIDTFTFDEPVEFYNEMGLGEGTSTGIEYNDNSQAGYENFENIQFGTEEVSYRNAEHYNGYVFISVHPTDWEGSDIDRDEIDDRRAGTIGDEDTIDDPVEDSQGQGSFTDRTTEIITGDFSQGSSGIVGGILFLLLIVGGVAAFFVYRN